MPVELDNVHVQQFLELYNGRTDCVLVQRLKCAKKHRSRSIKIEGPAKIQDGLRLTTDVLLKHFNGGPSLGYTPLMSDGRVWSASIDIDIELNIFELEELIRTIPSGGGTPFKEGTGLPLSVLRSKSDGAHLTVFFSETVARDNAVSYLQTVAKTLHLPLTEKVQTPNGSTTAVKTVEYRPTATGDDAVANGGQLYLPYWGCTVDPKQLPTKDDESVKLPVPARVCVKEGRELSLTEFLDSIQRVAEADLVWPFVQAPRYEWQVQPEKEEEKKEKKKPGRPKAEYIVPDIKGPSPAHIRAAEKTYRRRLETVEQMVEGMRDDTFNKACWWTGRHLGSGALQLPVETVREELAAAARVSGLDESRIRYKVYHVLKRGMSKPELPKIYAVPTDYTGLAEQFLFECHTHESGVTTLCLHKEDYYIWTGLRYVMQSRHIVKHQLWNYLKGLITCRKTGEDEFEEQPFKVNPGIVSAVNDAINSTISIDVETDTETTEYPFWIRKPSGYPDSDLLLPNESGLTIIEKEQTFDHTPLFFNRGYSKFAAPRNEIERPNIGGWQEALLNPDSARASCLKEWLKFLRGIFYEEANDYHEGDIDLDMIMRLQEMMGLVLMPKKNRERKLLFVIGPPDSGKGTLEQIVRVLIGAESIAALNMGDFADTHGLENIVGRRMALVTDARLSDKAEMSKLISACLNLTESNPYSINPKGKQKIALIPEMDVMVYGNEALELLDRTGAIKARIVVLETHQSFTGREDGELFHRLMTEIQAIYVWAIEGAKRLKENGYRFWASPSRTEEVMFDAFRSPLLEFLKEFGYTREQNGFVWKKMIYGDYVAYAEEAHMKVLERSRFFKELYKIQGLKDDRRRYGGGREFPAEPAVCGLSHPKHDKYTEMLKKWRESGEKFEGTF
ncbi:hypothetical protein SAMN04488498_101407 [Mesorhizobium albiziae]|uniref:SF3 helicase domain-containing protein n=2 Tax=Neomesorhizobium albiziae TaxID=335020 RepID=A0A1I3VEL3_9HYPH|nr:hypothetical protein SAMN04488498_101407 [Mesorhizobium albiziae]